VFSSIPALEPLVFQRPAPHRSHASLPLKVFKAEDRNEDIARFSCKSGDTIRLMGYGNDNLSFQLEAVNFHNIRVGDRVQIKLSYDTTQPMITETRVIEKLNSPYALLLRVLSVQERHAGCFHSTDPSTLPFFLSKGCILRTVSKHRLPPTSHARTTFAGTDEHLLYIFLFPEYAVSDDTPSFIISC
jgi:hypothetical protein